MFGDLAESSCPCGTGLPYAACCQPLHRGARQAETAVELMRSRYAAYAVGGTAGRDYVFRTWHPRTRPALDDLDATEAAEATSRTLVWTGLTVHDHGDDWVEFTARYETPDGPGELHERSRFQRRAGRWTYVDGEVS